MCGDVHREVKAEYLGAHSRRPSHYPPFHFHDRRRHLRSGEGRKGSEARQKLRSAQACTQFFAR